MGVCGVGRKDVLNICVCVCVCVCVSVGGWVGVGVCGRWSGGTE